MQKVFTSIVFASLVVSLPLRAFALMPDDPLYTDQWYLERIGAPGAWNTGTGSREVIVAVLDSGVDVTHEDLKDNIWENSADEYGDGVDNDHNGFIDDTWGYDFVRDESLPVPFVSSGQINPTSTLHGTLVSGVIGAIGNNGLGVSGISWSVRILPVRVLNEMGDGDGYTISRGLHYAVDQGAKVVNLSFSGPVNDSDIEEAVRYAYEHGVVVVSAVGNEGKDVHESPAYPACTPSDPGEDWVIGVAASDALDERAFFSNYGKECIDITAPGTDFTGVSYFNPDFGYDEMYTDGWSGTSLAAPVVTGVVSLILGSYPGITPDQMKTVLQLTADPIEGEYRSDMGAGRVNVERAFVMAGELWERQEIATVSGLDFIRIESSPTVYLLLGDGTRRVVLDTNTFYTYENSFKGVRTISDSEMATYKLKGTVLPRANRVLVKIQSDPKVYWLSNSGTDPFVPTLRAIPDEDTAIALFGADWDQYVIDIDVAMFSKFFVGTPVSNQDDLQTDFLIKRTQLGTI
jgi:hypothetical protein